MRDWFARLSEAGKDGVRIPIATKLILSFLLIITLISAVFIVVGIRLIGDRIVAEAQEKVRYDLNAAREIYLNELGHVSDVVRFAVERFFLINALMSGNIGLVTDELARVKIREGLDILTLTDASGKVLLRTNNVEVSQDDQSYDELVGAVLYRGEPVSATSIVSSEELSKESPELAEAACCEVVDTPLARVKDETEITDGMMLKAAAPVFDYENNLIGVLYGGVLLNNNFEIVDKIKQTVFEELTYDGRDIGTATIFQDDV